MVFDITRDKILQIVNLELIELYQQSDYQKNIYKSYGSKDILILDLNKSN